MLYPTPIAKLIDSFSKLPGIGAKTATRLAFYTISMSDEDVNDFAKNLLAAKRVTLMPAGLRTREIYMAVGSDIEYADEVTLLRAIENRTEL